VTKLEDYRDRFRTVRFERSDTGVLLMTLHNNGGPYVWDFEGVVRDQERSDTGGSHAELAEAAGCVARDLDNRVVIITGTGDTFSGPRSTLDNFPKGDPQYWDNLRNTGTQLLANLLDIQAPVITCLNGPAYRHAEIPVLGDIVLAADHASIVDSGHFPNNTVPGDGINLIFPFLMGWNRGRYFHLMGQELSSRELLEMGLVNEVVPAADLLPRAHQIAAELVQKSPMVLRYTRLLLVTPLKAFVQQYLGYSFAMEALAAVDSTNALNALNAEKGAGR